MGFIPLPLIQFSPALFTYPISHSYSTENLFILVTLVVLFQATKQLTVSNVRTMRMNDDVLVVAISPDAKYIAVALLDSTVKVRFTTLFCLPCVFV